MKKKIDEKGKIIIPKGFRDELKITKNQLINIEVIEDRIIITNPDYPTRTNLKQLLEHAETLPKTDFNEGYKSALKLMIGNIE